jgi:hypothetical protein
MSGIALIKILNVSTMIKKIILSVIIFSLLINTKAGESNLFPEIPGWKMKEDPRVYNSQDLWELIDGAADIFLSYYFEDIHIAEYTNKDQIIRVELYRHRSIEDTYGIYTAERMPDYPQVLIGSQGYKSQGVLNFMAGNYYIKVMSAGVTEADEKTIALVAGKVDAKLAQPVGLPELISFFPEDGKVSLSDNYIAQNFLGYSFFHHAFSARYDKPVEFQLFIIKLTPEEIKKILDQYFIMMKEDKVQQKEGLYVVNDLFNGSVFLKQKDSYLVGVFNTNSEETATNYINKVIEKFP